VIHGILISACSSLVAGVLNQPQVRRCGAAQPGLVSVARKAVDVQLGVRVKGSNLSRLQTGHIERGCADSFALWTIDTAHNEAIFVRQTNLSGASEPSKALKTTLKAELDAEAWAWPGPA
jgi:hypothetical protein